MRFFFSCARTAWASPSRSSSGRSSKSRLTTTGVFGVGADFFAVFFLPPELFFLPQISSQPDLYSGDLILLK